MTEDLEKRLHGQVWSRFIRMPEGHLLDFADEAGNTVLPTKEECERGIPNICGWSTPIANGAFFGGLYLYALCEKYAAAPDETLAREILVLVRGLFSLCDVSPVDGFIARGVADDGVSHYRVSSEDQVGPWLLGLHRFLSTDIPDGALRQKTAARIRRTSLGVKAHGYNVPTEWETGETLGTYAHDDFRGSCKALYVASMIDEFAPEEGGNEYETMCAGHPDGSVFARHEIAAHGFAPDMVRNTGLIQFWIDLCAHFCLRELAARDEKRRADYEQGIAANGRTAMKFADDLRRFGNTEKIEYVMDWRLLRRNTDFGSIDEAMDIARGQAGEWRRINPRKAPEHDLLCNALSAVWIALTSGDARVAAYAKKRLDEGAARIRWETLGCSYAFLAEAGAIASRGL